MDYTLTQSQRFFDQVGHQTTYASIGNKHFFTKSCHRQTYQNYEEPPQRLQNSDFQSHFSASISFFENFFEVHDLVKKCLFPIDTLVV